MFKGSVEQLGDVIKMFVDYQHQMQVEKDKNDVILKIVAMEDQPYRLLRNIKRLASGILFSAEGKRREAREQSLLKKYQYEVVCVEKSEKEWLTIGIKTPVGIIIYE